jgi:hypothetical protein
MANDDQGRDVANSENATNRRSGSRLREERAKESARRERLSWLSSGEAPRLSVSQDGVEDDEELADAGGERLFGGFSGGSELLIMRGDDRVGAACDQRGHVEGGSDRRPASGDCLRPRNAPLSRLMGATPTRLAILRRSRRPSSGSSAIRVRRVASPTPG